MDDGVIVAWVRQQVVLRVRTRKTTALIDLRLSGLMTQLNMQAQTYSLRRGLLIDRRCSIEDRIRIPLASIRVRYVLF